MGALKDKNARTRAAETTSIRIDFANRMHHHLLVGIDQGALDASNFKRLVERHRMHILVFDGQLVLDEIGSTDRAVYRSVRPRRGEVCVVIRMCVSARRTVLASYTLQRNVRLTRESMHRHWESCRT